MLKNCLFGAVTLTESSDINVCRSMCIDVWKCEYSDYGIGFDRKSNFSFPGGGFGQDVLVFGADMSSSVHVDNKEKDILVIRKRTNTRIRTHTNCRKNAFD